MNKTIIMAVLAAMAIAVPSAMALTFTDDFESYSAGTLAGQTAPNGQAWTAQYAGQGWAESAVVSGSAGITGNGVENAGPSGYWGANRLSLGESVTSGVITVSADIYNNYWAWHQVGLRDTVSGKSVAIGFNYGYMYYDGGLGFSCGALGDENSLAVGSEEWLRDKWIHLEMQINLHTRTVRGSLQEIGGIVSATFDKSWDAGIAFNPNVIELMTSGLNSAELGRYYRFDNLEVTTSAYTPSNKKLIELGHDAPKPFFARDNYQVMDQTPLDGTCFLLGRGANSPHPGDPWDNLSWGCWQDRYFQWQDLEHHVVEMQAAQFQRLVNNFIIMTIVPGTVDWFDDFGPVVHNYRMAARIAKQVSHCKGIVLDTEPYETNPWEYDSSYGRQKYTDTYTFDQYAAQTRLRGSEIMQALQEEYPGITVFVTHSYTLAWLNWMKDPSRVKEPMMVYGLLPSFLDGLHDAAGPGVKIVDGRELAYRYKQRWEFEQGYNEGSQEVMAMVGNPQAYERLRSLGFGLYLEAPAQGQGSWTPDDPTGTYFVPNGGYHFSPAEWEQSLCYALEISDEYVWMYTERAGWWGDWRPKMPQEFYDATVRARQTMGLD